MKNIILPSMVLLAISGYFNNVNATDKSVDVSITTQEKDNGNPSLNMLNKIKSISIPKENSSYDNIINLYKLSNNMNYTNVFSSVHSLFNNKNNTVTYQEKNNNNIDKPNITVSNKDKNQEIKLSTNNNIDNSHITNDIFIPSNDVITEQKPNQDKFIKTNKDLAFVNNKKINKSDTKCMAEAIVREAGGEPYNGQLAVAHVIRNRSIIFGKSPCLVVHEKIAGHYQFSFMSHRKKMVDNEQYANAKDIANQVLVSANYDDITKGAQFFHRCKLGKTHGSMKFTKKIGNHCFYNNSNIKNTYAIESDEFVASSPDNDTDNFINNQPKIMKKHLVKNKKEKKYIHIKLSQNFNPSIHRPIDLD